MKPPEGTGGVVMTPRRMLAGALVFLTVCFGLPLERASEAQPAGLIRAVGAVGMTVGNMERSTAFYSGVLGFEKISDVEVVGEDYERLQGVFGLRMRVLLQGPGRPPARDLVVPGRQGRSEVAPERSPLPWHRPHRDRRQRYRAEPSMLSGYTRPSSGRRERELRAGARAPEQRLWRPPPHHGAPG